MQVRLGAVEGGEIRDAIIVENFNWATWHVPTLVMPSAIEVCKVLTQHFDRLRRDPLAKEFMGELTSFVATPNLRAFLESKYEGKIRDLLPESKANFDHELTLKACYSQLVGLLINSA